MPTFHCAAILFDLDGVLVDSTRSVTRQWRLWAEEYSIDPDYTVSIAHGRRSIEVIRMLAPQLDAEEETVRLEAREAADREGVEVMPGAGELLGSIPEGHWCVVTSGTHRLATSRLRLASLPVPEVLVAADDVVQGKPHPEPYLKGAELLGMKPEDCLVIEDAPYGIEAAHAAGMKAIALPTTFAAAELKAADAVAEKLLQIKVSSSGNLLTVTV